MILTYNFKSHKCPPIKLHTPNNYILQVEVSSLNIIISISFFITIFFLII